MQSYRLNAFSSPFVATATDPPAPKGREVLMDVTACGLCHSDIHLVEGFFDLGNGGRIDATRIVNLPRTLGHEVVGTVHEVGQDVTEVEVGDKRVVYPWIGCGHCGMCRAGNEHLCSTAPNVVGIQCDGGFASKVLVPNPKYLIEYGAIPETQACTYACAGLTAYSALKKLLPFPEDGKLLVIGAGGVGLSGIRFAHALGLPTPVVAETDRNKWDLIRESGVSEIVDPAADGALRILRQKAGGGVRGAIDFVGSASSFSFGLESLSSGGKLVSVGLFGGAALVSPGMVAMKALSVLGSMVGSLDEMHEMMAIARSSKLPGIPVTARKLDEVNDAFEDLKRGRVRGRVVMVP